MVMEPLVVVVLQMVDVMLKKKGLVTGIVLLELPIALVLLTVLLVLLMILVLLIMLLLKTI